MGGMTETIVSFPSVWEPCFVQYSSWQLPQCGEVQSSDSMRWSWSTVGSTRLVVLEGPASSVGVWYRSGDVRYAIVGFRLWYGQLVLWQNISCRSACARSSGGVPGRLTVSPQVLPAWIELSSSEGGEKQFSPHIVCPPICGHSLDML